MPDQSFHKNEKVKSRKTIAYLFSEGKSVYAPNVKLLWECGLRKDVVAEAGFAVPKKNIRRAVDRNYLKRIMREVYRKNKHLLISVLMEENRHISVIFLYQSKQILDYYTVETAMIRLLEQLSGKIRNS